MYVIYINDRPLVLRSANLPRTRGHAPEITDAGTHLTAKYSGKPRTLLQYADMLEKGSPKVLSVDLVADDPEQLWADFRGKHKWVPAAGGLVRNTALDRYLFIFRRGTWDLPKGKIDEGEDALTAALREVEEETGAQGLVAGEALPTTYHTYRNRKGKRVLKPTYWFRMETISEELLPEAAEGIEQAVWKQTAEVLEGGQPFYASLRHFLTQSLPPAT